MTQTQPLLVIAAGGTGGHMFPAQALAEAMVRRGWRVKLTTDVRGARYTGGFPHVVQVEVLSSATFARGGVMAKAMVPPRILSGILSARRSFRRDRPAVVVGFGGYPAIPAMGAAITMGLPRMIHEQNGVLGRVNQLFARRVNAVACGTWPTELPAGVTGQDVGNPVRAKIMEQADVAYAPPSDGPIHVLVIGGSQGARILSDHVPAALARLPGPIRARLRVSHQARDEDMARVIEFYANHAIAADVQPFFLDVPRRLADAQLVIARSGASTIADLTLIGRPAILVPLAAAIRDEQTANARGMVEAGAATLLTEDRFTPDTLSAEIAAILSDPDRAASMAAAAKALGKPDATQRLVDLVLRLSQPA